MNQLLRYFIIFGVFALFLFIPIIVTRSTLFPFISGKGFFFRIIVEIIFGAWLILAIRDVSYRPRISSLLYALGGFLGVMGLATIFAENPFKSFWSNFERMEGYITLLHLGAYFIVVSALINTERLWRYLFHGLLGTSIFVGCYSILQLYGEITINQGGVRVDATLGNAAYLGGYTIFTIFLGSLMWIKNRTRVIPIAVSWLTGLFFFIVYYLIRISDADTVAETPGKIMLLFSFLILGLCVFLLIRYSRSFLPHRILSGALYAGLVLLNLFVLYNTATRGAILGLIVGVIMVLFLLAFFGKTSNSRVQKGALVALISTAVLLGGFFLVKDADFLKGKGPISRIASISLDDAAPRFMVWNIAWQGIKERPIFGWGQENFNFVFNTHYDPRMFGQEAWFDRTHNILFDWFIAGGVLGLVSYLSLFATGLYLLWRRSSEGEEEITFNEKVVLTGLISAYFFSNLFVFDNTVSYVFFFGLLAYIHSKRSRRLQYEWKIASSPLNQQIATSGIIILTLFSLYFFNAKGILAARGIIDAFQNYDNDLSKNTEIFRKTIAYDSFATSEVREHLARTSGDIQSIPFDEDQKQELYELAKSEMRKQVEEHPRDARFHVFMGSLLNSYGEATAAISYLEDAHELSPRKQDILFELGSSYLNLGNPNKALEFFKEAYDLDPTFSEVRIIYATGLIYAGNVNEAKRILAESGQSEAFDQRLIRAYLATNNINEVISIYERELVHRPNDIQLRISLAVSLANVGRSAEAIKRIEEAIEIDPALEEQGNVLIQQIRAGNSF